MVFFLFFGILEYDPLYPLYPYGYAFFLFWVYIVLTTRLTMNTRGVGWVLVLCFLLLNKASALRMVFKYRHMPLLSFHAFICPLISHSWQGFTLLFSIAYNQPLILSSVRLKWKRQGKPNRKRQAKKARHRKPRAGFYPIQLYSIKLCQINLLSVVSWLGYSMPKQQYIYYLTI